MLAALLLTSAVTLGVAALTLFSPLESRLRDKGEAVVLGALRTTRPAFSRIHTDPVTGKPDAVELGNVARQLRRRAGGQTTILDGRLSTVYSSVRRDLDVPSFYLQARTALATRRIAKTLEGELLIAAAPLRIGSPGKPYIAVVTRRLEYVALASHVVSKAFAFAAAAGLAIALVLGLWLTRTLLRRLERLHDVTRQLGQGGLEAPLPADERPDEIGDLTRAFASMQARLRHQEAARRAFVATASHELRTPLASLDGTLELLADDLVAERLDIEDARERTDRAREQSRRLSNLASDLLDLSRLDAEVELRAEPVELSELCRAVAAEFDRRAGERGVRIEMRPAGTACWAMADPGALARIVRILLDNALGVAPAGSTVSLRSSTESDRAQIVVSDEGPGVPREERERIFERFERGSTTGGRSGFGLGLAIGRELAQRMGGTLVLMDDGGPSGNGGASANDHSEDAPAADDRGAGARFAVRLARSREDDNGEMP
jgi:signal transduction histidine kinase